MIAVSCSAARRLISMARAAKGSRRSVPGKIAESDTNHRSLSGHHAWMPKGRLASAPNQSSRACEAQASPQISPIR
jgi:hypothetical protein